MLERAQSITADEARAVLRQTDYLTRNTLDKPLWFFVGGLLGGMLGEAFAPDHARLIALAGCIVFVTVTVAIDWPVSRGAPKRA